MINNLGFTLTPDSMVTFRDATWPMLVMSFLAYAGNTFTLPSSVLVVCDSGPMVLMVEVVSDMGGVGGKATPPARLTLEVGCRLNENEAVVEVHPSTARGQAQQRSVWCLQDTQVSSCTHSREIASSTLLRATNC